LYNMGKWHAMRCWSNFHHLSRSSPEQPDRPTSGRQTLSRSAAFFGPARTRDHYFCFSANIAYFSSSSRVQTDNLALAVNNYTARSSREPENSLSTHTGASVGPNWIFRTHTKWGFESSFVCRFASITRQNTFCVRVIIKWPSRFVCTCAQLGIFCARQKMFASARSWFAWWTCAVRNNALIVKCCCKNNNAPARNYLESSIAFFENGPYAYIGLGNLRRLTMFLGASHWLENMKCARIMKNGVDWHQLKIV
jgi:hypothetical protein